MKIKLTFLGTGSAFAMQNFQTNAVITFESGYRLLIDCGGDIRMSLAEEGLTYLDINGVYISHLHSDHVGGMEYLAFTTYFDPRYQGRPDLFISEFMVDNLWTRTLSGGLGSLQNKQASLETYFDVRPVEKNGSFQIVHPTVSPVFRLIQMIHFVNAFTFEPSFGLMFQVGDEKVFITTDTQHAPNQIQDFYDEATVIIHDCETTPFRSGVHAHFDELSELDEKTREKLWLVHYQDNVIENGEEWDVKVAAAGFRGFVVKGKTFEFSAPDEEDDG